jgi:peptide-methionine (R)-S-oxide reductase
MKTDRRTLIGGAAAATFGLIATAVMPGQRAKAAGAKGGFPVTLSDAQWKARLSPAAYRVLRHEDTERAGSSPLDREKRRGTFACAGCNNPVYRSVDKFDSGTGWPSFTRPIPGRVATKSDRTWYLAERTEVHCARCGGHLGHVFDDGPKPTGKRYCMNGVAMKFLAG